MLQFFSYTAGVSNFKSETRWTHQVSLVQASTASQTTHEQFQGMNLFMQQHEPNC